MLFRLVYQGHNDIGAGFNTDGTAVQADIIILGQTPGSACVVLIIDTTALILFLQTGLRRLFGLAVKADNSFGAEVFVGINVRVQAVIPILQNIIRISAYNDTWALFRNLKNYTALDVPKKICCGEPIHDAGDALV